MTWAYERAAGTSGDVDVGCQRQHLCCPVLSRVCKVQAMRLLRFGIWRAAVVCAPGVQLAACAGGEGDGGGADGAVGRGASTAEVLSKGWEGGPRCRRYIYIPLDV